MDDTFPDTAVRVYWHMDDCQLATVESSVIDHVFSSLLQLVKQFGFQKIALQGHYTFEKYRLLSHEQWELGYLYHVEVERYSQLTPSLTAVGAVWSAIREHIESYRRLPLFLITGDVELLQAVQELFRAYAIPASKLVVCTALSLDTCPELQNLLSWGAYVYGWSVSQGVSQMPVNSTYSSLFDQVAPLLETIFSDSD